MRSGFRSQIRNRTFIVLVVVATTCGGALGGVLTLKGSPSNHGHGPAPPPIPIRVALQVEGKPHHVGVFMSVHAGATVPIDLEVRVPAGFVLKCLAVAPWPVFTRTKPESHDNWCGKPNVSLRPPMLEATHSLIAGTYRYAFGCQVVPVGRWSREDIEIVWQGGASDPQSAQAYSEGYSTHPLVVFVVNPPTPSSRA
jgi:hypothetical protein